MRSNNIVFRNSEGFNGPGNGGSFTTTWPTAERSQGGPMTLDTTVQKSGIALGTVIVFALLTWVLTPDVGTLDGVSKIYTAATVGSLAAFVLSMVNSFKRVISPALVVLFCAAEGVALGGLSKVFDAYFGGSVVTGAVIGTFGAFAGTLLVYSKFLRGKISSKFYAIVTAIVLGFVGLSLMELVLGMFGKSFGLFGMGTLGLLTAVAGVVLGVLMLVMDFDYIEQGIRNGLPERESWRAAFALTVSLVWIYTNLLRLLAIIQGRD